MERIFIGILGDYYAERNVLVARDKARNSSDLPAKSNKRILNLYVRGWILDPGSFSVSGRVRTG